MSICGDIQTSIAFQTTQIIVHEEFDRQMGCEHIAHSLSASQEEVDC